MGHTFVVCLEVFNCCFGLASVTVPYVLSVQIPGLALVQFSDCPFYLNIVQEDWSTGHKIGTRSESLGLHYLHPHSSIVCIVSASLDIFHCLLSHPCLVQETIPTISCDSTPIPILSPTAVAPDPLVGLLIALREASISILKIVKETLAHPGRKQ
ncbi:hypothetical protein L195_g039679 [Trifolium pratense]|uniref:Uncharacterized protein n=1 Tax=Trifolium pratense TaxID=57577 RepID=A0A2K3LYL9_TRIPR|nr:hypothetical protein L195_g039679 [Trifolium pratense]